ncbi:MAG: endopeptidase La [Chloroherpetonaceae bacterium]|nr:endopeptidase La [Chloroherpetonaceae bacterium]
MSETKDNLEESSPAGLLDNLAKNLPQAPPSRSETKIDTTVPVLPLRNTVLFPDVITPVSIGRKKSILLIENLPASKQVAFVAQLDAEVEEPTTKDLYSVGTVGQILKVLKLPDGSASVIVQGLQRVRLESVVQDEPYLMARVSVLDELPNEEPTLVAFVRSIKQLAAKVVELSPNLPNETSYAIQNIDSPPFLVHFIASNLNVPAADKQGLLEAPSLQARAEKLIEYLAREAQILELTKQIQTKVKMDMDKAQREFYLRQQLKTIQAELGEYDLQMQDAVKLREALAKKSMPDEVRQVVEKEIEKLLRIPQASPDYSVTRNYIDTLLSLPWHTYSSTKINLHEAERVLNEDHYGLEKVKARILEYLAVLKLKSNMKAPILCFCGPPGVGKTSLGKSIARALGRAFIRVALGGVRDEAEIRGHRRTYIGAMPGRIIQGIKRAGTSDPVFMLDEIDKLGSDFRGDPSSALLEVLDPAQNSTFSDHYLEVSYDLSRVLFIATANTLDTIPLALKDRMEVIHITGYTDYEKLHIAKEYLLKRQMDEHGILPNELHITDSAMLKIINSYTREAGVRNLEREIASICRSVAKDIALAIESEGPEARAKRPAITIEESALKKYLGLEKYFPEMSEPVQLAGVAIGLAWTPVGGDILFIESTVTKGSGRLTLTGQLGDVMKESAQAALSYLKSCAEYFRIPDEAFRYWDVHLHIPQGAIPKDGPSAGVSILTSLASIYTQRKVKPRIAMTGEITLRGHILPVGGIKEKILAARRAGITEILLPERNRNDVLEVMETNKEALENMSFKFFSEMDDLLDYALEPISDEEAERLYSGQSRIPEDAERKIQQEEEEPAHSASVAAKKGAKRGDLMIKLV